MRLLIYLAAALWIAQAGAQVPNRATSCIACVPQNIATFKADPTSPGATIPADFVGFSFEVGNLVSNSWFTGSATSLSGLMGLIGPNGSMRFGGATSDTSTVPNLTQTIVNNLNTYLGLMGSGWSAIYGLNITANNSALAATQAGMLVSTITGNNLILQMGNEPGQGGSPNYSIPTYESRWNAYYAAIIAGSPGAKFAATDSSDFADMPTIVGTLTPGTSGMTLLTQHWYPLANPPVYVQSAPNFLFPPPANSSFIGTTCTTLSCLFGWNNTYGTKRRLTETNSVSGGGAAGYSNTLLSAAWVLQLEIAMANAGWEGLNVHSDDGSTSHYSPLILNGSNWSPGPIFYGMYLFAQIEGKRILPVTMSGQAPNSGSIAVLGSGGNASILVVNYDTVNPLYAIPDQVGAWSTAKALILSGSGCADTAPTLGGAAIGAGGSWSGGPTTINKGAGVSIPSCGAALIQIQP